MTIQQTYDDKLFTVSYIVEVSQEEATILLVLPLLLEGRLGIKVDKSFRSTYTIGTDSYEWEKNMDKVIITDEKIN